VPPLSSLLQLPLLLLRLGRQLRLRWRRLRCLLLRRLLLPRLVVLLVLRLRPRVALGWRRVALGWLLLLQGEGMELGRCLRFGGAVLRG
jgi:hypothetical protein